MLNGNSKIKQFFGLPSWMRIKTVRAAISEGIENGIASYHADLKAEEENKPWWKQKTFQTINPLTGQDANIFELKKPKFNFFDKEGNDITPADAMGSGMDNLTKEVFTMDFDPNNGQNFGRNGIVPGPLLNFFTAQSFIGWQTCALVVQNWIVAKACMMKGRDAVRNGWKLIADGKYELTPADMEQIEKWDVDFDIKGNIEEADYFKNVFGIRHVLYVVENDDDKYYENPFNPEAIKPGTYKGMSQIDPYWMAPLLSGVNVAQPANANFYEPEYWTIAGKVYHHTHFVISYGPELPDILKPSYLYGGIPLTQRIMERVYAAEKTANEIPILVMSKRLNVKQMDLIAAVADQTAFTKAMQKMAELRDNFGFLIMGKDEKFEQFQTTLADLDECVMTQYQLVAAIAEVPAVKLLETTPKGFNATGDFESDSYHETLESLQENDLSPILARHHECLTYSLIIPELKKPEGFNFTHEWNPLKVETADDRSQINLQDSVAAKNLWDIGAVDAGMVHDKLIKDEKSGYSATQGAQESGENLTTGPDQDEIEDKNDNGFSEVFLSTGNTKVKPEPVANQLKINPSESNNR